MTSEWKKYAIRFGVVFLMALPIMILTQGANAAKLIGYKVALIAVAVGLCELLWVTFFKPVFGKTEAIQAINEKQAVLIFRGILYAAIILALSLGL